MTFALYGYTRHSALSDFQVLCINLLPYLLFIGTHNIVIFTTITLTSY